MLEAHGAGGLWPRAGRDRHVALARGEDHHGLYYAAFGFRPLTVRFQGAWASQADTMPDTYLREAQTMVLEAQERCLSFLRSGGDLVRLLGVPVGEGGPVPEDYQEAARSAMASSAVLAADEASLAREFFDEAFTTSGWDGRSLGAEAAGLSGKDHPGRKNLVSYNLEQQAGQGSDEDSEASILTALFQSRPSLILWIGWTGRTRKVWLVA